jgi:hypothetical protein
MELNIFLFTHKNTAHPVREDHIQTSQLQLEDLVISVMVIVIKTIAILIIVLLCVTLHVMLVIPAKGAKNVILASHVMELVIALVIIVIHAKDAIHVKDVIAVEDVILLAMEGNIVTVVMIQIIHGSKKIVVVILSKWRIDR